MGKTYDLQEAPPEGNINLGCDLVGMTIQSSHGFSSQGNNADFDALGTNGVKPNRLNKELEAGVGHNELPEPYRNGLPPGVKPGQKGDPFRVYRYCKQFCLIGVWMCIGLSAEIVGPTIPDLMERLCVDYEEISRALMGKSVGVAIGSIVGGFCNEIFYSHVDLFMSLSLYLMAAACICLPLVDKLWYVFLMMMLNGIGDGIINTGGNPVAMHLWGESVAPHMMSLHFGFGLGALIAPQIARPFLSPTIDDDDENYTVCDEESYVNGTSPASESRIEIAYAIIGVTVFAFACVVLGFYIYGTPEGYPKRVPNKSLKKLLSANSCARGYINLAIALLALLFFFFMQAIGGERAFGKFLFSFAIEADVAFTKDEATYLQSAFWASFTFGRLAGVPVATFASVNRMIIANLFGAFVTSIVLSIWGATNSIVLWVFTCFMGIFIAVVYPNGMTWSNTHLDMNSMAMMLLVFGGACGGFIYQGVTGSLFENVGPETLMYVMVAYSVALTVVYSIMQTTVVCHAKLKGHTPQAQELVADEVEVIQGGIEDSVAEKG